MIEKDARTIIPESVQATNNLHIDLEGIVKRAIGQMTEADRLRLAQSGDETEGRTELGNKLDHLVTRELRMLAPGNGWIVHVNRAVRTFPGIDEATCGRTIEEFVRSEIWYYVNELRPMLLSAKSGKPRLIGNLRPDLIIQDPTNVVTVWDLTSRDRATHLVKTILYAHVFARGRYLCKIGETFWAGMCVAHPSS